MKIYIHINSHKPTRPQSHPFQLQSVVKLFRCQTELTHSTQCLHQQTKDFFYFYYYLFSTTCITVLDFTVIAVPLFYTKPNGRTSVETSGLSALQF